MRVLAFVFGLTCCLLQGVKGQDIGQSTGGDAGSAEFWAKAKEELLTSHFEAISGVLSQLDLLETEAREANDIEAVKKVQKQRVEYLSSFKLPAGISADGYESSVSKAQAKFNEAHKQLLSSALRAKQDELAEMIDREFKLLSNPVVVNARAVWSAAVKQYEQDLESAMQKMLGRIAKAEDEARSRGDLEAVQKLKADAEQLQANRLSSLSAPNSPASEEFEKARKKVSDANRNVIKALLLAKQDEAAAEVRRNLEDLVSPSGVASGPEKPKQSEDLVENSIGMTFVRVPKGTFLMGGGAGGGERDELPAHTVTISKDFFIGRYEVTQKQYKAVTGRNPSFFRGDKLPVESIDWATAVEFCEQLSDLAEEKVAGRNYRLPTEAEWEFACRAGTTTTFYFGDDPSRAEEHAWFQMNAGKKTHEVGLKKPNNLGLFDMNGNVWEWCSDWHGKYPALAVTDPTGPDGGANKTTRGAGYIDKLFGIRASDRGTYPPDTKYAWQGFRVVLILD